MNYDRILGAGLLIVGTLGIVTTPIPTKAPVPIAIPTTRVLEAGDNYPAGFALNDPKTVAVLSVPIASTDVPSDAILVRSELDTKILALPIRQGEVFRQSLFR